MSDTPRTDAFLISSDGYVDLPEADHIVGFCRGMEREINDLRNKLEAEQIENAAIRKDCGVTLQGLYSKLAGKDVAIEHLESGLAASEEKLKQLRSDLRETNAMLFKALSMNTDLRAKLAAAEKDAARYRWLRNHAMCVSCADDETDAGNFALGEEDDDMDKMDANIDAAMKEQP